jgi:hypothetical protein
MGLSTHLTPLQPLIKNFYESKVIAQVFIALYILVIELITAS